MERIGVIDAQPLTHRTETAWDPAPVTLRVVFEGSRSRP